MFVQYSFDFSWIDILSAGNDHILSTSSDVVVALIVLSRQISRIEPAVAQRRRCRFAVPPVTRTNMAAAKEQFADLAANHIVTFFVDDARLTMESWEANGSGFAVCVLQIESEAIGSDFF